MHWPYDPGLDIYLRKLETYSYKNCTQVYAAALFLIVKQYKCPSGGKWIHKLWYIQTTDCYLTIHRIEPLIYATICTNLKD